MLNVKTATSTRQSSELSCHTKNHEKGVFWLHLNLNCSQINHLRGMRGPMVTWLCVVESPSLSSEL